MSILNPVQTSGQTQRQKSELVIMDGVSQSSSYFILFGTFRGIVNHELHVIK